MTCSMSRKGKRWENKRSAVSRAVRREGEARHNAPTERFFNSYENERVHGTRHETRAEAVADAFDSIEPFYNRRCRHSTPGYPSPQDFLANRIRNQHEDELAA